MKNSYQSRRYNKRAAVQFNRYTVVRVCMILAFLLVVGQLFSLQVLQYKIFAEKALNKYSRSVVIPAERGNIYLTDRYGDTQRLLAGNTTMDLLYVDPLALQQRFDRNRKRVLENKMSVESFPHASLEEYYTVIGQEVGSVVNMNPLAIREHLVRKYNDHITLLYEPPENVVFLLSENPIEGVYLFSEYDRYLYDIRYEDDDFKIAYINNLEPEEREEMKEKILEIYVDPTRLTIEIPDQYSPEAKLVLEQQNIEKLRIIAQTIHDVIPEYDVDKLQSVLARRRVRYEPIKKKLSLEESRSIRELDFYGLVLLAENFRYYPEKNLLSTVLGFVDREGKGQYGIEGQFANLLRGADGKKIVDIDNKGNQITVGDEEYFETKPGSDLILTIDRSIQQYTEKILRETIQKNYAEGGQIILMHPKTGAILAMASYPDFDPNNFSAVYERDEITEAYLNDVGPEAFFNRAIASTYEPGSTYKIFTVATALDSGEFNSNDTVCDETGEATIQVDNRVYVIQNASEKAHGCMTFSQLLEKSSNIGALRVSLRTGSGVFRDYLKKFNFGGYTDIGFDVENPGNVKDMKEWGKVALANAGFGQGFTATPLQVTAATASLANQGKYMRPYIIQKQVVNGREISTAPFEVRRTVKPNVANEVVEMMVNTVDKGLGDRATIPGYSVAGKTGTSQTVNPGGSGYSSERYITSFVGFAPAYDPEFVMLVKIDYPKSQKFGSLVAAPAFQEIGKFVLQYLEIPPDR